MKHKVIVSSQDKKCLGAKRHHLLYRTRKSQRKSKRWLKKWWYSAAIHYFTCAAIWIHATRTDQSNLLEDAHFAKNLHAMHATIEYCNRKITKTIFDVHYSLTWKKYSLSDNFLGFKFWWQEKNLKLPKNIKRTFLVLSHHCLRNVQAWILQDSQSWLHL